MLHLKTYDPQEMFDAVARHLALLEGRAWSEESKQCEYVTVDGRRCAVGGLIVEDDDTIRAELDGESFSVRSMVLGPDAKLAWVDETLYEDDELLELLVDLQEVHDASEQFPVEIGDAEAVVPWDGTEFVGFPALRAVAVKHGLNAHVCDVLEAAAW